jgi:hypothetical protein
VCISFSLAKYVWEFVHCYGYLRSHPSLYAVPYPNLNAEHASWTDEDVVASVASNASELDSLIGIAGLLSSYEVPHFQARYPKKLPRHPKLAYFVELIIGAETLVALHEVGHLLNHGSFDNERLCEHEIQADASALSLCIALASTVKWHPLMLLNSSALTFNVLRHFNLCRRTFAGINFHLKRTSDFDMNLEMRYEEELQTRVSEFSRSIILAGFPSRVAHIFERCEYEFFFVIEATKRRLLDVLGNSASARQVPAYAGAVLQ